MTSRYKKAYTEVLEILNHLTEEEFSKIPKEKIDFYKRNMDKEYVFKIDTKIDLSNQHISKEANAILISLFKEYFATERQKGILDKILSKNQEIVEKERQEKYNVDNIFEN